jgi:ATP-dependent helicase/nuclease subunit B
LRWTAGELALVASPAEWPGIAMRGVIDRVDALPASDAGATPARLLIDYKTGNTAALRTRARSGVEDTQLVFYAALLARQSDDCAAIEACYLPLDDGDTVKELPHEAVADDAQVFVEGIGHDLVQLLAGAPMPALGEGSVCTFCEARGLCRRDHWDAAAVPP